MHSSDSSFFSTTSIAVKEMIFCCCRLCKFIPKKSQQKKYLLVMVYTILSFLVLFRSILFFSFISRLSLAAESKVENVRDEIGFPSLYSKLILILRTYQIPICLTNISWCEFSVNSAIFSVFSSYFDSCCLAKRGGEKKNFSPPFSSPARQHPGSISKT